MMTRYYPNISNKLYQELLPYGQYIGYFFDFLPKYVVKIIKYAKRVYLPLQVFWSASTYNIIKYMLRFKLFKHYSLKFDKLNCIIIKKNPKGDPCNA